MLIRKGNISRQIDEARLASFIEKGYEVAGEAKPKEGKPEPAKAKGGAKG